jgi:antitoxin HigA-1
MKIVAKLPPLHPGEMLREEFLKPMELTPYAVAKACGVPRTRIERIVREELVISADTALRLAKFFGMSVEFWINLQTQFDLEVAKKKIAKELKAIEPVRRKAACRRSRGVADYRRQQHRGNDRIRRPCPELRVVAQRIEAARRWKGGAGMRLPILRREGERLRSFGQGGIKRVGGSDDARHVGKRYAVD